jgi:hypothetical protein
MTCTRLRQYFTVWNLSPTSADQMLCLLLRCSRHNTRHPYPHLFKTSICVVYIRSLADRSGRATGDVGSNPTRGMDVGVCDYSVFMLSCVQIAALRLADPMSKESYQLYVGLTNWKRAVEPYRVKERKNCVSRLHYAYMTSKSSQ